MLRKGREAWALHLLFCALPKRAEVKSQGNWRILCCMPTDQVSGAGEECESPWRDRCLNECVGVYTQIHTHMQVFVCVCVCVQLTCANGRAFMWDCAERKKKKSQCQWYFLLIWAFIYICSKMLPMDLKYLVSAGGCGKEQKDNAHSLQFSRLFS